MTTTDGTCEDLAKCGATRADAGICRRDLLRQGARAAFLAPLVMTFFASQALAGSQVSSLYPPACVGADGLCVKDSNCCSNACTAGICN